jgi:hypothetical protein
VVFVLAGLGVLEPVASADETIREDSIPVSPRSIVARAFQNLYGFSSVQRVDIRAGQIDGQEFLRSAQVVRRGTDEGLNRMLVRFIGPPNLRGIGVLLHERRDFSYDAFLYQPIFKRVRRVNVAQRHDAFFGTDLYFEDLESKRPGQWRVELLRNEKLDGRNVAVIELAPDGFPRGYERIVGWVDEELPVMLHVEFFRGGKRLKVLDVDPARVVEQGGYHIPTQMVFHSELGTVTTVDVSEVDIRSKISKSHFTMSALEFGDHKMDREFD